MRTRWVIAILFVIALVGGGSYVYVHNRGQQAAATPQRIVPGRVQRLDLKQTVTGTAPIGPSVFQWVKANVTGTVVKTMVNEGDLVKKGAVLLTMSNDQLVNALASAQQDLTQARLNLDSAMHPTQTALENARLKVDQATVALANRQQDVDSLSITAPFAGTVTNVKAVVGDSPGVGAVVSTLYDSQHLQVLVAVNQSDVASVHAGQDATVTVRGVGDIQGSVTAVSAQGSGSGREAQVPVAVALMPAKGVRPGMEATVAINVQGGGLPIRAAGSVGSTAQVDVKTKVAGSYASAAVGEGDQVQAGQTLAVLDSATVRNALASAQDDLKSAQIALNNLLDPTRDPGVTLDQLKSKVASAELALANQQQNVHDLTVYAPADGTVSGISDLHPGDKITPNQQLVRVLDYNSLQVVIPVDELDISKVKVGQAASAVFDALPGKTYGAKVSRLAPEGTVKNDIATFNVWLTLDQSPDLRAGMTAQVEIVVDTKTGALAVPVDAVRKGKGGSSVMKAVNFQPGPRSGGTTGTPGAGNGGNGGANRPDTTPTPTGSNGAGRQGTFSGFGSNYDRLENIPVTLGVTDGNNVEVKPTNPDALQPGDWVVTAFASSSTQGGGGLFGRGGGPFGGDGGPGGGGQIRTAPPGQQRPGG